jgi:hypothetical protein
MRPTRLRATIAAVAACVALAGCSSDDQEPKVAPSPRASPSSSATATPSSDAVVRGPDDAVQAWVDARNLALRTGDLTDVRALSDSACKSCVGVLDSIEDVYDAGGRFETKGWVLKSSKIRKSDGEAAVVDTAIVIRGGTTFPSAGAQPVQYEVERSIVVFRLRHGEDGWRVSFIGFLS